MANEMLIINSGDYFCDEMGNVFSGKFGKVKKLKPMTNKRGYLCVCLHLIKYGKTWKHLN